MIQRGCGIPGHALIGILVDSRLRIDSGDLPPAVADELRAAFTHRNHKREAMKHGGVKGWWAEPVMLVTWYEDEQKRLTLPRGGMQRLREVLEKHGLAYGIRDARSRSSVDPLFPDSKKELWAHQVRIVDGCLARENCLVKSGTGSGKTSAVLALAGRLKVETLVVVHSRELLNQWVERAVEELGLEEDDVGVIGDGQFRIRRLTIGTVKSVQNAIDRVPGFADRWGAVIADEVHLFAAATFMACIDRFSARYRVGVSDDEKRKDKKEVLLYDCFGQRAAEVSDEEIIEAGHVMEVELLLVPTEFAADWYAIPEGEDDDRRPDFGLLLKQMGEDAARNALVEGILRTELADGRQVLMFSREREHCRVLGAMAKSIGADAGYMIGGPDYKKEFSRTRKAIKAGKARVGIGTYQALATAIDLPSVEVGISTMPILANKTMVRQTRGRICRKPAGKTVARLYQLWDRRVFGLRHVENAARWSQKAFVWSGGEWVPARQFLKSERIAEKEA